MTGLIIAAIVLAALAVIFIALGIRYLVRFRKQASDVRQRLDTAEGWTNFVSLKKELRYIHLSFLPFVTPEKIKKRKGEQSGGAKHAGAKQRRDGLFSLMATSFISIAICFACLVGMSLAWFSDGLRSTTTFTAGSFDLKVNIEEFCADDNAEKEIKPTENNNIYELKKGVAYKVKLTADGTAEKGFGEIYYLGSEPEGTSTMLKGITEILYNSDSENEKKSITFTFYPEHDGYYGFTGSLGEPNNKELTIKDNQLGNPSVAVLAAEFEGNSIDTPIHTGGSIEFDLYNYVNMATVATVNDGTEQGSAQPATLVSDKDIYYYVEYSKVKDGDGNAIRSPAVMTLNVDNKSYGVINATDSAEEAKVVIKGDQAQDGSERPLEKGTYKVTIQPLTCICCEQTPENPTCKCANDMSKACEICRDACLTKQTIELYFVVESPYYDMIQNNNTLDLNIHSLASTAPIIIKYENCNVDTPTVSNNTSIRIDDTNHTVTIDTVSKNTTYNLKFTNYTNNSKIVSITQDGLPLVNKTSVPTSKD